MFKDLATKVDSGQVKLHQIIIITIIILYLAELQNTRLISPEKVDLTFCVLYLN